MSLSLRSLRLRRRTPRELDLPGIWGTVRIDARTKDLTKRLKPGDIFGEMSLVTDQPTSATVRATMRSSVLFLAREYVERLAEAIPQVQAYFEQVALNRARDNTMRFDRGALPSEAIEVDLSDVVLV